MKPNRKRRVLRSIDLSEISLVDAPAVEPALIAIVKRKEQAMSEEPKTFEGAVAMFKARGMSGTSALRKAADEHPALFEAYQVRSSEPATKAAANGDAIAKFRRLVDGIAKRDSCPVTKAMQRAAEEHPDEFAAYQRA